MTKKTIILLYKWCFDLPLTFMEVIKIFYTYDCLVMKGNYKLFYNAYPGKVPSKEELMKLAVKYKIIAEL